MRFVERVAGEFLHEIEYFIGENLVDAAFMSSLQELGPNLGHLFWFLLIHRAPQKIGLTQTETGQHLGDLHHLLLVKHDTIGIT